MKLSPVLFLLFAMLVNNNNFAQTNPSPQAVPFSFSSQTGGTLPPGIALHRFGTTAAAIPTSRITTPGNADLSYNTGNTTGGWRGEGDNGIGILASGSNAAGALVVALNTTGKANIQIEWTVRTILNQASRDNSIALQYRIGTVGDFVDIGSSTTFSSTDTEPLDFNTYKEFLPSAAENQPEVQVRFIYWESSSVSGSRDRLAIDDIKIDVGCTPPTNQPTGLALNPSLSSIDGSFTAAIPGSVSPDGYLVLVSTSASLTDQPASGSVYAVDDVVGNAIVVSVGSSTTFVADELAPSTPYYFFVYSYSNAENCYKLSSPLSGTASTLSPPACTPPSVQASGLSTGTITGTSIDLQYTRGNGDNILIIARPNTPVTEAPVNSVTYTAGSEIGSGNTVIYNGPASTFSYTGLSQNTTYHFALYEYFTADKCYTSAPLTGNFTTSCITPVNVTALNGTAGNTNAVITWTNPSNACFSEVLVVASNATIPATGDAFAGSANTTYSSPNQVVYRGTGTTVTVTGLSNGTPYYFRVFTKNGSDWSSGVEIIVSPRDPATSYVYVYGNLHAHSSYSDGNKDTPSKTPKDDYEFARDANCMDFLGISEHNHSGAGLTIADYPKGYQQANEVNGVVSSLGNSIVTLWGMEWGVISGGGHMLVYGFDDQLIGWEPNNYNIYVAKSDYASLFNVINAKANSFATLAHPNTSDYGNISATYSALADNAIVSTAVESGPAFSTSTSYNDFPSSLAYLGYYKRMLAKGYRLGAQMDHDNHNMTFGKTSTDRMVVLAASKSRTDIVSAIREMRFFASQDCNVQIDYKINENVMGSSVNSAGVPTITLTTTDLDNETVSKIELWGGIVGGTVPAGAIKSFSNVSTITFDKNDALNTQPDNSTWYYFTIITQADGNKIVSSPIWYSRNDALLPINLITFNGAYNSTQKSVGLVWKTAQEINSKSFVIERASDGTRIFSSIGTITAAGSSNLVRSYTFNDPYPKLGENLYRLKILNLDGTFEYSKVVSIDINGTKRGYFSLSPNPAHSFTYINSTFGDNKKITIELLDMSGRRLSQQVSTVSTSIPIRFSLTSIKSGMYMVRITEDTHSYVEKLIVR